MKLTSSFVDRVRAFGLHFMVSLAVAGGMAGLVFGLWYPGPYRHLAGGQELFWLVVCVDVILGPVLTFAVFDLKKAKFKLILDLSIVGMVQMVGLLYGLHTVYQVRPVALVFEVDRFRVVTTEQIRADELPEALPAYRRLSVTGPLLLSTRGPRTSDEKNEALFLALQGFDLGQRPSYWQPYQASRPQVLERTRSVQRLLTQYPERAKELGEKLRAWDVKPESVGFLPVIARGDWVAVIDKFGDVVGFLPVDGFF